tara:strand:+ start:199 stop:390 length:192 start_codon:yes stop_codon:yes gene_type:complete
MAIKDNRYRLVYVPRTSGDMQDTEWKWIYAETIELAKQQVKNSNWCWAIVKLERDEHYNLNDK